ncbi:MAG: UvrD-helicase domain-containing protein [Elusimicrobiota bacterium]
MTAAGMQSLADAADRDRARTELGANIIVEAGAGTGKTTLLIDRIVFLLLGGGLEVSRLVALTFTEKAAAEIKFRLAERLNALSGLLGGEAAGGGDAESARRCLRDLRALYPRPDAAYREAAENALRNLEQAQMGTIHSFCAHLLRLYPLEAGVDPNFRVDADGTAFEEIFDLEWALWLDRELGERASRAELWEHVLSAATLEELAGLARGLANPRVDLARAVSNAGLGRRLRELGERAEALGRDKPAVRGRIVDYLDWLTAHFFGTADALEGGDYRQGDPPTASLPSWPKSWPPDGREEYKRLAAAAGRLNSAAETLTRGAVALVKDFVLYARAEYRRRGWISFDGLLVGARDLVRDYPRVREELKTRFGALLIDEFQDTDPLQGELLMYLAEAEGQCADSWRETVPAAGKLFVVGDAKQSIYRFRGADIAAVEAFTEHLVRGGAQRCALRTNFRSRCALVDSVNKVFQGAMLSRPGLQPAYREIAPAPGLTGGTAPEWVRFGPGGGEAGAKLGASARRRAEAAWIADWIRNRRGEFTFRDIAVVVRTTTDLNVYLEQFKAAGVPYVVEAEKYFYGTQEVSDFLNLLRAIDDPGDRVALAGLLRSPLVALDDREVHRLALRSSLDYRKRVQALEKFYGMLRQFHARAGREPLGSLLRAVLRDTFLVELCARAYHHQQTASNLLKFGRLADEASEKGATLKEFIDQVARSKRERLDEGESPLADESYDAVRVLTIHKAKGLEYPVVILPNLSGGTRSAASDDAVRVDWGDGTVGLRLGAAANIARVLMDGEERTRQREEDVRVLYVAMTRPKERLILLGGLKGESGSFSAIIEPGGALCPLDLEAARAPRPAAAAGAVTEPPLPKPAVFAAAWEMRRAAEKQALERTVFIRPSEEHERGEEAGCAARGEDDLPAEPLRLLGRLCHEALEHWDFTKGQSLRGEPLAKLLARRAAQLALQEPLAAVDELQREAAKILKRFLASKEGKWLARTEIAARELPLLYEENGQVVRGTIDALCRDGEDWVVVDYKSDRIAAKDRAKRSKAYARQGRCYVRAVERALRVRGVKFKLMFLRTP